MKTFIRVRSEYFEVDSSKYRLGITSATLIPSLQSQTSKDFTILLEMSPMDPQYTKRKKLFGSVGVRVIPIHEERGMQTPRLEIIVGDDDFLVKKYVEVMQAVPQQKENTSLVAPNGYSFTDGEMRVCSGRPDIVQVTQIVERHNEAARRSILVSAVPGWIHVRHRMNSTMSREHGPVVNGLNWIGWDPVNVDLHCGIRIAEATAMGCEAHPTKSKSVIYAKGSARNRRKR